MKRFLFPLIILFLVIDSPWVFGIGKVSKSIHPDYVPGELLIKFKPGVHSLATQAFHARIGAQPLGELSGIRVQRIKIPATTMTMKEAIQYYQNNLDVEYVEPNYIIQATAIPNDPDFNQLWALNNDGQTGGAVDADIDAPEAWDVQTGSSNVIIAVVDSGAAYTHPDFDDGVNSNIWSNSAEVSGRPGIDDDGNGYIDDINGWDFLGEDNDPTDCNGHGTHVAGTIAALGDNNAGVTGVNWRASVMPLRILGPRGFGNIVKAAEAIIYAADNGAMIINASWGWDNGGFSQTLYDAISYANQDGCVFVAAAGNSGNNNDQVPFYPASFNLPNIIAVAATDHFDSLASFSNYGATAVDVAAPGVSIRSSVPLIVQGPEVEVLNEDFELGLANWTHWGINALWNLTEALSVSPTHSLADSPSGDYLGGTNSYITYDTGFNLVDKEARLECKVRYALGAGDSLSIGGTIDGAFYGQFALTGSSGGSFQSIAPDISLLGEFTNNTNIGFHLFSNNDLYEGDGVYIDDVVLKTQDLLIGGYGYNPSSGTSMAAPHVAGLAALIWAEEPGLTHSEVKERILKGVEVKMGLRGQMVTGGRINAHNSLANVPPSPSNLSAAAASDTQINLSWSDNSYGESGFKIQRKEAARGTYEEITTVAANTTLYSDTGLTPSTTYHYQVMASNGVNDSEPSNEAAATAAAPVPLTSGGSDDGGCFIEAAIFPKD
ncbi:MAG: S8 family serine peptidase [Proteobacteria bacterium]|nr:S8 family serine peptidase [Pseudomonadota bacterium]